MITVNSNNPDYIIPNFLKLIDTKKIKNITAHAETVTNIKKLSKIVQNKNINFGLAINPKTSVNRILDNISYIDLALIMTVEPGFAGQMIISKCIKKVEKLKNFLIKNNLDIPIQVDGGIKLNNISLLSDVGANIFVSGTGIFKTKDYKNTVKEMVKIIDS